MHLLVRESRTLDEAEAAYDPGPSAAPLLFLSFSDSDLGAWSQAAQQAAQRAAPPRAPAPAVRLESLARLRHPMSVDLLVEQVVAPARCVVIRLLGGLDYWRYGVEEVASHCRAHGIALLLLPGCERRDPRLAEWSTVDAATWARMDGFLRQGGPRNAACALALAAHLAGLGADDGAEPEPLPEAGEFPLPGLQREGAPLAAILFYRSHLASGDTHAVRALAEALHARGLSVRALFASSLKQAEAASLVGQRLLAWRPAVILSATAFSAKDAASGTSPLDRAGVPVLQVVLAVGAREAWLASSRGLSQTDLAMQVVLPELDGRLLTGAISFKAAEGDQCEPGTGRTINRPDADGIALAADRAAGWARLGASRPGERRVAIVLSDYPGIGGQQAHAVGLDSFASLRSILGRLHDASYAVPRPPDAATLAAVVCQEAPARFITLAEYGALRRTLPDTLNDALDTAWGAPDTDPACVDGGFQLRHLRLGNVVVAVQPDRGSRTDRRGGYHDADSPPRHAYVAFMLWLRLSLDAHAMLHLGTHGTLEWLPGKAAALSAACWPVALLRGLPVIYPFIVNNPGEAAVARRRLGAVCIGHLTPPLGAARPGEAARVLERLIDDYAAADGLDRRRGAMLRGEILTRAGDLGLLAESGADREPDDDQALARLDAWLCDVKELQIRDGLHVFGEPPASLPALRDGLLAGNPGADPVLLEAAVAASAQGEAASLLAALDASFVPAGPAGAPSRGRLDVLPTGRNLYAIDPRAVPTPGAMVLAAGMASLLLERHRRESGEELSSLVIDLWGSTTLRTGGEDFALALVLIGATPLWHAASGRITGIEIVPLALLDRPRVDVTLRISGLFRDSFEAQIRLFDEAVRAVAKRGESPEFNPLAALGEAAPARIFGPAAGAYGAGTATLLGDAGREAIGQAYLDASSTAYTGADIAALRPDGGGPAGDFAARVAASQALLHQQDHAETDLLDSPDYAAHEGGFAAAAALLGNAPVLYHADSTRPDTPRLRHVAEEVARVVRGRLANPDWIAGMMRHGYRGAAEIARGLAGLHGFGRTLPERLDRQYELVFAATLADPAVDDFLHRSNPAAREDMRARFRDAIALGLWQPRANSVIDALQPEPGAVGFGAITEQC
ncbi:cobaltochelatase subunit CobN [Lichenicoccus sp.]|uniref:cobaltochelatase subunit CobN n=1 Tax=Lichenicoccus sp. TaxID=2781899 RepID=UPI003D10300B